MISFHKQTNVRTSSLHEIAPQLSRRKRALLVYRRFIIDPLHLHKMKRLSHGLQVQLGVQKQEIIWGRKVLYLGQNSVDFTWPLIKRTFPKYLTSQTVEGQSGQIQAKYYFNRNRLKQSDLKIFAIFLIFKFWDVGCLQCHVITITMSHYRQDRKRLFFPLVVYQTKIRFL